MIFGIIIIIIIIIIMIIIIIIIIIIYYTQTTIFHNISDNITSAYEVPNFKNKINIKV